MSPDLLLAGSIGIALCLYFLFGGADFGGGVWDLLASGPRAAAQRRAVGAAIGPVWEANHVWLILVIVVLFTGFPPAFAAISVALHVPLTLFTVGVVLRGSAFAFRALDLSGKRVGEGRLRRPEPAAGGSGPSQGPD
jgi:cytochrome d ubiquinol oxidase subunit II